MRDFFDVSVLAQRRSFDGALLLLALRNTFQRRGTVVLTGSPLALTPAFAEREEIRTQWAGFMNKTGLAAPADFAIVIASLAGFLTPVLDAAAHGRAFDLEWSPGGPWR